MTIECPFCKKKYDHKKDCHIDPSKHKSATVICECGESFDTTVDRIWFVIKRMVSKKRESV